MRKGNQMGDKSVLMMYSKRSKPIYIVLFVFYIGRFI